MAAVISGGASHRDHCDVRDSKRSASDGQGDLGGDFLYAVGSVLHDVRCPHFWRCHRHDGQSAGTRHLCFTAKERCKPEVEKQEKTYSLRDMFTYLVHNKYLLIFWIGYLVSGVSAVGGAWGLYLARYCLGDESMMTVSSLLSMVPALAMGVLVPMICKKVDKFKFYCISIAASGILTLISRFVGYENIAAYLICSVLIAIPGGFTVMLGFMFTPDCAEYGVYKTGKSMPGITFAIQSFFVRSTKYDNFPNKIGDFCFLRHFRSTPMYRVHC